MPNLFERPGPQTVADVKKTDRTFGRGPFLSYIKRYYFSSSILARLVIKS